MGYKSPRSYTISGNHTTVFSPADATAYAIGGSSPSIGTAGSTRRIYLPTGGVVRSVCLSICSVTAIGTNEDWTVSITDGTTTVTVATTGIAQTVRTWINQNINLPVVSGGYIYLTTTTPTWVTNPEGCSAFYVIVIDYE